MLHRQTKNQMKCKGLNKRIIAFGIVVTVNGVSIIAVAFSAFQTHSLCSEYHFTGTQ